jgi:hypothetical protein
VAARAVTLRLEDSWDSAGVARRALESAGLLVPPAGVLGLADVTTDTYARSAIGRRAGALLLALDLRSKRPRRPPRRRPTAEEKALWGEAEAARRQQRAERDEKLRREKARRAAADATFAALPEDEQAAIVDRELVLQAIDW